MSARVEFSEAQSIIVGRILRQNGYYIADSRRVAETILGESDSIGIIDHHEKVTWRGLLGLLKRNRRFYLGTLFFDTDSEDEWLFEAYGREQLDRIKKIIEQISASCDVKILIRLVQEESAVENFDSDFSSDWL